MSRPEIRTARTRPVRGAFAVGAAVIGAVAIAGCGAGQITQTDTQVSAVNGASATAGAIAVRNATFEYDASARGADIYPVGGSAPLQMSIVNVGAETDRLLSASSPVAASVQISGPTDVPGGQVLDVEGVPLVAAPLAPTGAAVPTAPGEAPGAPATPSVAATPAPGAAPTPAAPTPAAPTTAAPTTAAPAGAAASDGTTVVLTGLSEGLQVGPTYPLVLKFERAGELRVDVPVSNSDLPREEPHAE